ERGGGGLGCGERGCDGSGCDGSAGNRGFEACRVHGRTGYWKAGGVKAEVRDLRSSRFDAGKQKKRSGRITVGVCATVATKWQRRRSNAGLQFEAETTIGCL